MPTEPPVRSVRYLTADEVWAMNSDLQQQEGAGAILLDRGALESAIMRPQMAAHYEQADLATQAAILIAGIALAHPFLDANKRTALAAGATFLELNGYEVDSAGDEFGHQIEVLVLQHDDEPAATSILATWLRQHLRAR
jgi:death on curing protein